MRVALVRAPAMVHNPGWLFHGWNLCKAWISGRIPGSVHLFLTYSHAGQSTNLLLFVKHNLTWMSSWTQAEGGWHVFLSTPDGSLCLITTGDGCTVPGSLQIFQCLWSHLGVVREKKHRLRNKTCTRLWLWPSIWISKSLTFLLCKMGLRKPKLSDKWLT